MDHDILLNDDLDYVHIIEYGYPRKIYGSQNPNFNMDNLSFFRRFRLKKPTVVNILAEIENKLEFTNDLNNSVFPINQLLTSLRYYASAGHLISVADLMGMHVLTASRILRRVSEALSQLGVHYIKIPSNAVIVHVQHQFYQVASFPRIVGCIDGAHVKIQSPGASGYPLKEYLLTTLRNPITRPEQLYNRAHIRTRNTVERLFGVWKRHFPILPHGQRIKTETVLMTIVATAVLHNIAVNSNKPDLLPPEHIDIDELNYLIELDQIPDVPNRNVVNNDSFRQALINKYFANL